MSLREFLRSALGKCDQEAEASAGSQVSLRDTVVSSVAHSRQWNWRAIVSGPSGTGAFLRPRKSGSRRDVPQFPKLHQNKNGLKD